MNAASPRIDESPGTPDPEGVTRSWQSLGALSRPGESGGSDAAHEALRAALLSGAIRATRVAPLRKAVKRHLRKAWEDGILLPLARSRAAGDRVLLQSLAQVPTGHPESGRATLEAVAARLPSGSAQARHVGLALRYMDDAGLIARAMGVVERLAVPVDAKLLHDAQGVAQADSRYRLAGTAKAMNGFRNAVAVGLAPVVVEAVRAIEAVGGPVASTGLGLTDHALGAPFRHRTRLAGAAGRAWRARLAEAMSRDLEAPARSFVSILLRRHAGLTIGPAAYDALGPLSGRASLSLERNEVGVRFVTEFDLTTARVDRWSEVLITGTSRRATPEEVERALDARLPVDLAGPVQNIVRRLRRQDATAGFPVAAMGSACVVIGGLANSRVRPETLDGIVAVADEEGVVIRIMPDDDARLTGMMIARGFSWDGDRHVYMSRPTRPGPPSRTP